MLTLIITVFSCVCVVTGIQTPIFSLLRPQGLRISVPDESGIFSLVAVHFNVNQELPQVQAGTYNQDIRTQTDGMWVYEVPDLVLNPGDKINYWVYGIKNGIGDQITDQTWTVPNPLPPTTVSPTAAPSVAPTTAPSVAPTAAPSLALTPEPTMAPEQGTQGTQQPVHPGNHVDPPQVVCNSYPCEIFKDEFDTLDVERWQHEITMSGGGNWEFEYYTNNRSNSYVRDGVLYIKPTLTADKYGEAFLTSGDLNLWGTCTSNAFYGCERRGTATNVINPVQSARLRTLESFSFKYGRVEVEAKMPTGDWIWPAIWLLPKSSQYGDWPASGEIDLVESRGNPSLRDQGGHSLGVDSMGATLHFGPYWPIDNYQAAHADRHAKTGTFGDQFHKYAVEWNENSFKFFLDNEMILNVDPGAQGFWHFGGYDKLHGQDNPWKGRGKMAPFDQEFYIIMNVAVGGTGGYFPDGCQNAGYPKPWHDQSQTAYRDFWHAKNSWYPTWKSTVNNGENAAMQVRYVKVTKLKADP